MAFDFADHHSLQALPGFSGSLLPELLLWRHRKPLRTIIIDQSANIPLEFLRLQIFFQALFQFLADRGHLLCRFLGRPVLRILLTEQSIDIREPLGAVEFLGHLSGERLQFQHPGP